MVFREYNLENCIFKKYIPKIRSNGNPTELLREGGKSNSQITSRENLFTLNMYMLFNFLIIKTFAITNKTRIIK